MIWLIRLGAYAISTLAVWQYFHGGLLPDGGETVRHLALDQSHGMIFGVCAGFSRYFGVDVTLLRLAWVIGSFYKGIGVVLYLLAFLLMPVS